MNILNGKLQPSRNPSSAVVAIVSDYASGAEAVEGSPLSGIEAGQFTRMSSAVRLPKSDIYLTWALKKVIDRQPGMRAVLTRTKDVFIPLSKRVKIAKAKNADLFISIHADAFHDHSVRGG